MLSRRRPGLAVPPMLGDAGAPGVPGSTELAGACPWSFEAVSAAAGPADLAPGPATGAGGAAAESPGTTPAPDRRAMSARTALNHLISSSSLGAHSSSVRFVVTILNVCFPAAPPSGSSTPCSGGRGGDSGGDIALCRLAGRSYSKASSSWFRGIARCGLVSCIVATSNRRGTDVSTVLNPIDTRRLDVPYDFANTPVCHRSV